MNIIGRILLYGLAFGSAAAALTYVHFVNSLYAERSLKSAISVAGPMVIVGLAAFMFIRSINMAQPGIKMGKALFGSMCVGALVAVCTIMCYGIVMGANTDVRQGYEKKHFESMEKSLMKEKEMSQEQKTAKLAEMKEMLTENLSTTKFGLVQLQMYLSTTMVVSLITFLYKYKNTGSA